MTTFPISSCSSIAFAIASSSVLRMNDTPPTRLPAVTVYGMHSPWDTTHAEVIVCAQEQIYSRRHKRPARHLAAPASRFHRLPTPSDRNSYRASPRTGSRRQVLAISDMAVSATLPDDATEPRIRAERVCRELVRSVLWSDRDPSSSDLAPQLGRPYTTVEDVAFNAGRPAQIIP